MKIRRILAASGMAVLVGATACDSPGGPSEREVQLLLLLAGEGQTAPAGTQLPNPLVVGAYDFQDRPMQGVEVSFNVRTGGGTVSPQTVRTDANGIAQSRWTLGGAQGEQQATASVQVNGNQARVAEFRATATAGPAPQ